MEKSFTQSIKRINTNISRILNTVIEKNKVITATYCSDYTKVIYRGPWAGNRFWIIQTEVDLNKFREDIKNILKYETN